MHNRISLIGNVGNEPEIRELGDSKFASLSLGVTERGYTTKDGRKIEDRTTWFRVILWRGLAEIVEKYVHKGDKLFIEGKMQSRDYDKDGVRYTTWEVTATELELLTQKKDNESKPSSPVQKSDEEYEDNLPF